MMIVNLGIPYLVIPVEYLGLTMISEPVKSVEHSRFSSISKVRKPWIQVRRWTLLVIENATSLLLIVASRSRTMPLPELSVIQMGGSATAAIAEQPMASLLVHCLW
jgi:hypothetical protein